MTTDNKTLADVQPGGRVRLGDQALRVFSAGRWTYDGTGQSFSHEEMDAAAFVVYRDAALSAQPSPGGQGALKALDDLAAFCSDDTETVERHVAVIRAALAARQPVGEPVAYWLAVDKDDIVEFGMSADDGNEGQAARQEVNDFINGALHDGGVPHRLVGVYTAPPAQAVDLGRFRKLARWVANCAGHGINDSQRRMGEELLALIDSQAVGK